MTAVPLTVAVAQADEAADAVLEAAGWTSAAVARVRVFEDRGERIVVATGPGGITPDMRPLIAEKLRGLADELDPVEAAHA